MDKYDAIVVGAGNGGLVSALTLLKKGYNVLLLDEHNYVGGLNKSIKCGRFIFEPSFHTLYLDNPQNAFNIKGLLNEFGIKDNIDFSSLNSFFKVYVNSPEKTFYELPFGIDNFVKKIEEYVPNSEEYVRDFFDLALECKDAMNYIKRVDSNVDYDYMKDNYPTFVKIASYPVGKVMDILDVPLKAQEIINACWIYFGSPQNDLSFVQYAMFIYDAVNSGLAIPSNRSYEISLALLNKYLELGGFIKYNSRVIKVLVEKDKVVGVRTYDGNTYNSDNIIINSNFNNVYNKLINVDDIPKRAIKYLNKQKVGGRLFSIYLGLNLSCKDLGLDSYNYIIYNTLDSDEEFNRMKEISNNNIIVNVLNVANDKASSEGTCILELSTLFFDDCFSNLHADNYDNLKDNIADNLIKSFENSTGIYIRDCIEEIVYRTPVDVASINGNISGNIFGSQFSEEDNLLNRILNKKNEQFIKGLYLCGGFDGDIYNQCSSYVTGLETALDVSNNLGGE